MGDDLSCIFIRTQDAKNKWGSFSLRELLDKGYGGKIAEWFMHHVTEDFIELHEVDIITEAHVKRMIDFLEKNGVIIYRLKE